MTTQGVQQFPRGLAQPARGFRFAVDSLLLAAWAGQALRPGMCVLDLGCGSGVIGLGLLLLTERATLLGVDVDADMLACARENARRLGLEERVEVVAADVRHARTMLPAAGFGLVVCNPPWRAPGTGRPAHPGRVAARSFVDGATLADFLALAAYALPARGRCCLVHRADALAEVITACRAAGLEPKRLRCVHARPDRPARLFLLEARKQAGQELAIEPPLVLYEDAPGVLPGGRAPFSAQALALCPWLACNPGRTVMS